MYIVYFQELLIFSLFFLVFRLCLFFNSAKKKNLIIILIVFICSEVPVNVDLPSETKVNNLKRHGGPSMLSEEDKRFKKRHLIAQQIQAEDIAVCSTKKILEYETGEFLCNPSQDVSDNFALVLMIEILPTFV